jgi:polar amino acid transport system substrate-binding protein
VPQPSGVIETAPPTGDVSPAPSVAPSADPTPPPQPSGPPTIPPADALAAELATPGSLTVCIALFGAPAASINDEGQLEGYNVAFASEVATRLGLSPQLRLSVFDSLAADLASHECDVSVSSQNITESRLSEMHLAPYTKSHQPVVVSQGNPFNILTLEDLCGKIVSATAGSTHADLVNGSGDYVGQGLNDACTARGTEQIELRTFPSEPDAVDALLEDEVAAYLGNPQFVFDFPADLDVSEAVLPPARQGMATALDRPNLTAAVQAAIDEMVADGTYLTVLREYLPDEESVRTFSIVQV